MATVRCRKCTRCCGSAKRSALIHRLTLPIGKMIMIAIESWGRLR
jgi:hypothetical protein